MLQKSVIAFLSLLFCTVLQAQPNILWEKAYGGSLDDDAFCITRCYGNGFMIAGRSISQDGDRTSPIWSNDVWLVRINDNGDTLWQKSLGGTSYEIPYIIRQMPDSGYIFAGLTASNDVNVSGNHGIEDFWVVRTDSAANILWQKCYGGTNIDIAAEIKSTPDGGFVVCGRNNSNDGDISGNHGTTDIWVIRLDASGNLLWQKSLGGSSIEWGTAIIRTSDNGYLVGGSTISNNGDVSGNHGNSDFWVVKLDSTGAILWQKCYGGSGNEQSMAIVENALGHFVICGYTTSNNSGDVSGNHGNADVWLIEIDSAGTLIWQRCFGGTLDDLASHVNITPGGEYLVCGSSASSNGDVSSNNGGEDLWLLQVNASGNLVWETAIGGSLDDVGHFVVPLQGGNMIVTGNTRSSDGDVSFNHSTFRDYWTVMFQGPTTLNVQNSLSSTVKITNENYGIQISGLQSGEENTLTIFDISGRKVKMVYSSASDVFIPVSELSGGIYFLKINEGEVLKFLVK